MIYDMHGTPISTVYGASGNILTQVYDAEGNIIVSGTLLRVCTYNVGGWYIGSGTNVPADRKADYTNLQQTMLGQIDADILCFQEYWAEFCADGTTAESVISDYITQIETTRATTTWNGHAIAGNGYVLSDYESVNFEHQASAAPSYEKCYIDVGGKTICIFNTHLSTAAGGQKEPQSQEMLEAVANEPYFILMGDFNTETTDYDAIVKKFVDAGYHSANLNGSEDHFNTFYTSGGVGKPTDQIITSANIEIVRAYVNTTKLTDGLSDKIDHLPFVAELVIS